MAGGTGALVDWLGPVAGGVRRFLSKSISKTVTEHIPILSQSQRIYNEEMTHSGSSLLWDPKTFSDASIVSYFKCCI